MYNGVVAVRYIAEDFIIEQSGILIQEAVKCCLLEHKMSLSVLFT